MEKSSWMKIGRVYDVLSISIDSAARVLLRIVGEERMTPALFSMDELEIVDHSIPRNWEVHFEGDTLSFAPAAWMSEGFWVRFFDHDAEALKIFEEERVLSTQ